MTQKFVSFICLLASLTASAQTKLNQASWQQRVDYTIQVALNDSQNTLTGIETMVYYNNSPSSLSEIYIHLWPNAYLDNQTPFANQQVVNGQTDFYFAQTEKRGKIDSLNFKVDGVKVKAEFMYGGYEVCKLILPKLLGSMQKVEITTSFRVKLPEVFSRMGHDDNLYCVTQWYPKPAVYDVNGWNTMSYLDQGEFYSEFGKFDVSITVPKDYVVAATGQIQQPEEVKWWQSRTLTTNVGHPSKSATKTLQFIQDSVHDFAWFASPKFKVAKSSVRLKSGKVVDTWLFSEDKNNNRPLTGTEYINQAISFYSDKLGEYPYSHATVVVTPLKAGGGMEYPTITNVTEVGRQVIVHEVGHNWFYGILASNEREYPWMDESFNNYYEARSNYKSGLVKRKGIGAAFKNGGFNTDNMFSSGFGMMEWMYLRTARTNTDQSCIISSQDYTTQNYGNIIYGKASLAILQLQRYLGDQVFDNMMRSYYKKWQFKHPLPNDFVDHVKQHAGKNVDWFFNELMGSTSKPDYALKRVILKGDSLVLKLKNKGGVMAPFAIQTTRDDSVIFEKWVEPFSDKQWMPIPRLGAQRVYIDGREESIDAYRYNNYSRVNGVFRRMRPISFRPVANIDNPQKRQVFYSPIYGYNVYNKSMWGMAFYNSLFTRKKVEYAFAPMFATNTKDLTGYASIHRRYLGKGFIREMQLGVEAARFGTQMYTSNQVIGFDTLGKAILGEKVMPVVYEKLAPRITFLFRQRDLRTSAQHRLDFRWVMVNERVQAKSIFANFSNHNNYLDAKYSVEQKRSIRPWLLVFNYQLGNAQSTFQKLSAEYTLYIDYGEKKKGLHIRGFAGTFLKKPTLFKDERVFYRLAENNGYYDYLYDEAQFGRGQNEIGVQTLFTQQLMPGGSGLRTYAAMASTDSWLGALNLTSTIPGILPLRVFVDVAALNTRTYQSTTVGGTTTTGVVYQANLHYVTGVTVWLFKDALQINFPIFADPLIAEDWKLNDTKYGRRMTFTLKLNAQNPLKAMREGKLF